uniref:Uncharacterized protein n=1 Tax=Parascaris equorum TaxID=6256 RepID=A0A914R7P5_PAREQ
MSISSSKVTGILLQEWLASQIVECRCPVHPAVVELIGAYASSCVPEDTNLIINEPLSEKFIEVFFSTFSH